MYTTHPDGQIPCKIDRQTCQSVRHFEEMLKLLNMNSLQFNSTVPVLEFLMFTLSTEESKSL